MRRLERLREGDGLQMRSNRIESCLEGQRGDGAGDHHGGACTEKLPQD